MKIEHLVGILIVIILVVVIGLLFYWESSELYCRQDTDCACGVHINTGDCFFGNKNYVNIKEQCPDFCTGIAGHLKIKCIDNECKQIQS